MQGLAFVGLRLEWTSNPSDLSKSKKLRLLPITSSNELPPLFSDALFEVLAILAMQFGGYFFHTSANQVSSPHSQPCKLCCAAPGLQMLSWTASALSTPLCYLDDGMIGCELSQLAAFSPA